MRLISAFLLFPPLCVSAGEDRLSELLKEFETYSGGRLVFVEKELPRGRYHDRMTVLSEARKLKAAQILSKEVRKYPRGFFGGIGLRAVGIFDACISNTGDGFRPYDRQLKGYRYYGIWNGKSAVAGAYYTDRQLPLTFHHEVFHHVDATRLGETDHGTYSSADDRRFKEALSREKPYPSPEITKADIQALKAKREGYVLETAVSRYATKHPGEDQAETARHFMTTLADSLVQAVESPELEGSQRILHVMKELEAAVPDGPGVDWFVDLALGRSPGPGPAPLVDRMLAIGKADYGQAYHRVARGVLREAESTLKKQEPPDAEKLVRAAAALTHEILKKRIQPTTNDQKFTVWGHEDENEINWTLRRDVLDFASDASRLKQIADGIGGRAEAVSAALLKNLRLLARYFVFIDSNWTVTPGTQKVFESARNSIATSLPAQQAALSSVIKGTRLRDLAVLIRPDGDPSALEQGVRFMRGQLDLLKNPYLKNVDEEIADEAARAAIRKVQPACVAFGNASGVNLNTDGLILTAAHVVERKGQRRLITFPDGRVLPGICTAIDGKLDLALVKLIKSPPVPYAPVAPVSPKAGIWVACIGQPGTKTPKGRPTGYEPFHVSTGRIRGFLRNPLGRQKLGRTKHDAWTYWGHSGSPLFNKKGQIVAMHNSWDSRTAMRHAVPHQAIVHFLKKAKARFHTIGEANGLRPERTVHCRLIRGKNAGEKPMFREETP